MLFRSGVRPLREKFASTGFGEHQSAPAWVTTKNFKLTDPTKYGRNQAEGLRTPAEQEEALSAEVARKRKLAEDVARERSGSKRSDGEMRLIGSIPSELFRCVQRTSGDQHVWKRGGKELLKKHGLLFKH